ncbi:hypothetical protein B0H16DRAFT_1893971 [Mycena metata]|uniref:G domain-containing protein n=1 Tax=Mycena metata TaxID=1033252 RepID=A0AAD7HVB7_9AGAR|nr:hypothetical protein B0H16DRAFT_1893971 [Mycena metata]
MKQCHSTLLLPPSMTESLETQLSSLTFNEELDSTYDAIVESCPKFRILLIGRSGVGKSALINAVFGSGVAIEEHGIQPGTVPDINHEFVLPNNPRLVFHDSQGNEVNDPNWRTDFTSFGFARKFQFYPVPIVIVFTKFDKPVNKIKRKLPKTVDRDKVARDTAKDKFQKDYAESLSTLPASIPHVEVSKHIDFKDTLDRLVDLTEKEVKGAMSYVWASSQCPSADLKIKASIQIGKKKYWSGLSRSLNIPGRSLSKWLDVVLRDLVSCWGFDDPQGLLKSNLFKTKMTTLQEDLLDDESNTFPKIPLGAVATVAGIVSGVIPPAAPFAIPIAAGLVFAAWVYKVYLTTYEPLASSHQMFMSRRSPQVLRGLMGYIIDLTIVMQSLFWLTRARAEAKSKAVGDPIATVPLSKRLVELAYKAYATDEHSRTVHAEIRQFVKRTIALKPELVLGQIVKLIKTHRFQPSKGFQSEAESERGSVEESVNWDTGNSA